MSTYLCVLYRNSVGGETVDPEFHIAPAADHETLATVPAVPKTGLCPGTGDVIAN